jgi:hypothetical protein
MLSISLSTGRDAGASVEGLATAVFACGAVPGGPEVGARNGSGKFISGNGAPAGIGFTISGVTITISSVFVLLVAID